MMVAMKVAAMVDSLVAERDVWKVVSLVAWKVPSLVD